MNEYRTLKGPGESLLIEKKSKFIGSCAPVSSKIQAVEYINGIKAEHKDASSNVNAYYIRENNYNHSSDDGEPSGTAGVPVLEAIQRAGIIDAVVVVTRYFGGIPLGAGGLVRAYSSTASAALKDAKIAVMTLCDIYDIKVNYPMYDQLQKLLKDLNILVIDTAFTEVVTLKCIVKKESELQLIKTLDEFFRGKSTAEHIKEEYIPLEIVE